MCTSGKACFTYPLTDLLGAFDGALHVATLLTLAKSILAFLRYVFARRNHCQRCMRGRQNIRTIRDLFTYGFHHGLLTLRQLLLLSIFIAASKPTKLNDLIIDI